MEQCCHLPNISLFFIQNWVKLEVWYFVVSLFFAFLGICDTELFYSVYAVLSTTLIGILCINLLRLQYNTSQYSFTGLSVSAFWASPGIQELLQIFYLEFLQWILSEVSLGIPSKVPTEIAPGIPLKIISGVPQEIPSGYFLKRFNQEFVQRFHWEFL